MSVGDGWPQEELERLCTLANSREDMTTTPSILSVSGNTYVRRLLYAPSLCIEERNLIFHVDHRAVYGITYTHETVYANSAHNKQIRLSADPDSWYQYLNIRREQRGTTCPHCNQTT